MENFIGYLVGLHFVCAFIVGTIFSKKNRGDGLSGFFVGGFLGLFGVAIAICLNPLPTHEEKLINRLQLLDKLLLHNVINETDYNTRKEKILNKII